MNPNVVYKWSFYNSCVYRWIIYNKQTDILYTKYIYIYICIRTHIYIYNSHSAPKDRYNIIERRRIMPWNTQSSSRQLAVCPPASMPACCRCRQSVHSFMSDFQFTQRIVLLYTLFTIYNAPCGYLYIKKKHTSTQHNTSILHITYIYRTH